MDKNKVGILFGISFALLLSCITSGTSSKHLMPSAGVFCCEADGTAVQAVASYIPADTEYLNYKSEKGHSFHDYVGNIYDVWDDYQGDGIRVAVIDSGIDTDHPDFFDENGNSIIDYETAVFMTHVKSRNPVDNKFVRSRDTSGNLSSSGYIVRFDTNTEGSTFSIDGESIPIRDIITHWDGVQGTHGTSVSSTIASYAHDESHIGTIGIAPKVTLVPIKVDFYVDTIGAALGYIHELNTNSNPDDDIDVVNMSIEATSTWNTDPNSISKNAKLCTEDGTILFASAGNHNTNTVYYPASDPYIIGVGALDKFSFDTKADYSNYNASFNINWTNNVDITMVGNVYVAEDGGNYKEIQGTSFSSPICAGAAALWRQKYPHKTYSQFLTDLVNACVDIGSTGNDNVFGYGRLSIDKLLSAPSSISFDNVTDNQLELEVGETFQLEHTIVPADYDGEIEYTTAYDNIISVSDTGLITALAEGEDIVHINPVGYGDVNDMIYVSVLPSSTPEPETETYNITFGNSSGNGSVEITSSDGLKGTLSSGSDYVSSFSDLSKIYKDAERLKIGSNGNIGKFTVNLSTTISSLECKSITISAAQYGSDTGKIKLSANGSVLSSTLTPSNETLVYTFDTPTKINSIKIETTTNRAYINGISIECIKQGSTPSTKILSSITLSNQTTSLTVGSNFTFGGTVTAHYSDSSTANVTSSTTFSGYNMSVVDSYTVTASYTESSVTKTATYTLNVTSSGGGDPSNYYDSITATGDMALLGQLHDLTCTKHKTYNAYSADLNTSNYFKTDPFNFNSSYLRDFYSGGQMNNTIVSSGSGGWNREHVWPKSLSGGLFEESGAGADIQHLRPTVASINSDRGSKKYGTISGSKTTSSYSFNGTTYVGGYYTTSIFEPIDSKKGDVARIIMYLYMHYNTYSNFKEKDVTYATTNGSGLSSYFGTLRFTNVMNASTEAAAIETLLAWNSSDPIDDIERTRNIEAAKITGARNPFIDNSNYANQIWGDEPTPAKTLTSITVSENHRTFAFGSTFTKETVTAHYSDNSRADVTNSANFSGFDSSTPGQKTITVIYEENDVEVSTTYEVTVQDPIVKSFSLTKDSQALTSLSLDKYSCSSAGIVANITADTGADTSISWTYSKSGVAEVTGSGTNYTVTALSVGTTTVTGNCGGKFASFTVTVTDSTPIAVTSISISGPSSLQVGSSTTLTASVLPNNATVKGVNWTASPSDAVQLTPNDENNSVTVKAVGTAETDVTITTTAKDGNGASSTHTISLTAVPPTIESFSLNVSDSGKVPFGQYRTASSMSLKVHYSDGNDAIVSEGATISAIGRNDLLLLGYINIKVEFNGSSKTQQIYLTNVGSSSYVGVNPKTGTRAAGTSNVTPTEQAEAWAEFFVKETGGRDYENGPCKLSTKEARQAGLEAIWSNLALEYENMVGLSKDEFCTNTTNAKIVEAREHYKYIVRTYTSLEKFVENSSGTVLSVANTNSALEKFRDISIIVAAVLFVAGGAVLIVYFTFRKRKTY